MAAVAFGRRNVAQSAPMVRSRTAPAARPPEAVAPRYDDIRAEHEPAQASSAPEAASPLKIAIFGLVLLLVAVALPAFYFPELRRERALLDTYRPDFSVNVERADCSRYMFLLTNCRVNFSWAEGNTRRMANSSFLVGFRGMGGLQVVPMRSPADPGTVTSSVALDHLGNRMWTLVVLSGLALFMSVCVLMNLRSRRA